MAAESFRPHFALVAAVTVLLAAHVALVFRQLPPSSIQGGNWPVKGDVPRYIATTEAAQRVGGVGYDTSSMAGYTVGTWNSVGKKGYELLAGLFPGVEVGRKYYLMLVGLALVQPLVYWVVAWWLVKPVPSPLVLGVSLAVWHLDSQVADFWGFGNLLYPGACALLPLAYALAWRAGFKKRPWVSAVGLGLLSGWLFYAHTATMFALAVPVGAVAVWAVAYRKSGWPLVWIGLAAAIGIGLAFPWLRELLATRSECVPQPQVWFQAGPKHLIADLASDRGYARPFDRNFLLHLFVVAGVAGAYLAWSRRNWPVVVVAAGGLWCLVVTYTFSYVPGLRSVQPYRFLVPAVLCLAVPTCLALWEAASVFRASPPAARRLMVLAALVIAPAGTAYLLDLAQPPLSVGLSAEERAALDRIAGLPGQGRVVCQPDTIGHLIPSWTGKPVLGGLNDQAFVHQRFAGMTEAGVLFGRPCEKWSAADLRPYLSAYAVEYVVLSTPDWVTFANAHPDLFTPLDRFGPIHLYQVAGQAGYVHQGRGTVSVEPDSIRVTTADDAFLVLRFHYSNRLQAPAGVTLEPVRVIADDPVPFLGVRFDQTPTTVSLRCR